MRPTVVPEIGSVVTPLFLIAGEERAWSAPPVFYQGVEPRDGASVCALSVGDGHDVSGSLLVGLGPMDLQEQPALIKSLGEIAPRLNHADRALLAQLYEALRLEMTYEPEAKTVGVTIRPVRRASERVRGGSCTLTTCLALTAGEPVGSLRRRASAVGR
jgi:hypothetical protein